MAVTSVSMKIKLNVVYGGPEGELTEALTDNFQKLYQRGRHEANRWITAYIEGVEDGALVGIID